MRVSGVAPASYATLKRRLPVYAKDSWRQQISAACAAHADLGPATLVLYDVSTLYFETDEGDGFRESGFSKEGRLKPQIAIGLLTDDSGFPLMVSAFEGNKAETRTMLPVVESFMAAHDLPGVTVVADAGMVSESNQKQIEAAGLSFILGARIPHVPYVVSRWRREHPGEDIPDGQVFIQPWPAGPNGGRRDQVIYYQYRADRARRTLLGIDEQVKKAEQAVAGKTPVKRNRFVQLSRGTKTVNRELEDKARALAGLKGYVTNLRACPDGTPVTAEFVIGAYHQLFQDREKLPDVQERPAGPAGLPPQARLHRSPPHDRVRGAGGQPLDRASVNVRPGPVTSGLSLQVSFRSEQMTDHARHYAFPHAGADERRRLELFAERLDPLTVRRIKTLDLPPGARCLEVGGGRGSIARWLCEYVGPAGRVTATDLETGFLSELALANLEVLRHDVTRDEFPAESFDLVHVRAVLMHIPDRMAVLRRMVSWLAPGGWLLAEDCDFGLWQADFDPVWAAHPSAWHEAFPNGSLAQGRALLRQIHQLGLAEIGADAELDIVQPGTALAEFYQLSMAAMAGPLIASGVMTAAEEARLEARFDDPDFLGCGFAFIGAWGRRPAGSPG